MKLFVWGTVLIACAAFWTGLTILLLAVFLPDIQGPDRPAPPRPTPAPTSSSVPASPAVDKVALIIQQNVNCWHPIPGYVCTGREYR